MDDGQKRVVEAFVTGILVFAVIGLSITALMDEWDAAILFAIGAFISGVILWSI
jgi:hypothetical protein